MGRFASVADQLRDAITRDELAVFYQPIVTLAEVIVVGHEALVRWAHPTRGLFGPGEFLEVAEEAAGGAGGGPGPIVHDR